MTGLIDACQAVDRLLVRSIDTKIEPVLLLEDVESGSIRTWLRERLLDLDDEGLRNLDWKPLVGAYLVRAKYRAVSFLDGRTITSIAEMILKVKRPDYLGDAMWDLRHEGHPIEAKILDLPWLRNFQDRNTEVRPGDALRAIVRIDMQYGHDGEVVGKHYMILQVLGVIRLEAPFQPGLPG